MAGKSNKQYQLWGRFFSMNDPERIELHFACCLSKIIAAFITTPAGKGLNR
jgi:hypothetical protein